MSEIWINGRNLKDIIAEAEANGEADAKPEQAVTERSGSFGPRATVRLSTGAGPIVLGPSPDADWHLRVEHANDDELDVRSSETELSVELRSTSMILSGGNFLGNTFVGGNVVINGRVISAAGGAAITRRLGLLLPRQAALRVELESGSGPISGMLEQLGLEVLRAETGSGPIDLSLPAGGGYDAQVDTGSGPITARLPRDTRASLAADTGSGPIRIDHPALEPDGSRWTSRAGSDGTSIDLDTGSGPIRVTSLD